MAQIWLPNEAVNSPGSDATNFTTLSISHSTWGETGHTNNHSRFGSACPMLRGPLGPVSCVSPSITGVAQILAQRKPTLQWLHFWRALNVPNKTLKKGKTKRTLPLKNSWPLMKEHTEAPTCHQTTHTAEELAAVYKHGEQQEKQPRCHHTHIRRCETGDLWLPQNPEGSNTSVWATLKNTENTSGHFRKQRRK